MADYAFRTIEDRRKIQEMWEEGRSPREIAGAFEKSLDVVYTELSRGRDGTRGSGPAQGAAIPGAAGQKSRKAHHREKSGGPVTAAGEENRMKRKEIKWRREGRRVMTGRQDGVIFRIWTPYDAPEKGYYVDSHDTKGKGRSIKTADRKAFPTWEAAVEFCQQIMVGEVDLETMRAEFDAAEAEKERRAIRRAVAEAKEFRGHLERAGISYTTLLHLVALQEGMSGLAHNILLGYEHGEGWPDGT